MFEMFEDQYKLYECGEHEWGMLTISDNILEELSALNCNKHKGHLGSLGHFFEQPQVSEDKVSSRCGGCKVGVVCHNKLCSEFYERRGM
jgi:hypothetical protein